jgi:hypothetical protein
MVDQAWAAAPSPAAAPRQQKGHTPPASPGRLQAAAGAPAPQRKASARQLLERVQPGLAAPEQGLKQHGAGGGKEQGGAVPAAGRHPFELDTADRFLAQAMAQMQVQQGQGQGQQPEQAAQRQVLQQQALQQQALQQQALQAGGRLAQEQMPAAGAR